MHVLHVSHLCHLGAPFGTERYQYDLIAESSRHGVHGTLLWLAADAVASESGATVPVVPLAADSAAALGAALAARLDAEPLPALIHFHSMGQVEWIVARLARARGIPYVFTYHTPWSLCANGSLLRWGSIVCDGQVRPWRCAACKHVVLVRALPRGLRLARLRQWSTEPAAAAMAPPESMHRRARAVREFLAPCDRVLVHADPARHVLLANGVRPEALAVCAPGVSAAFADAQPPCTAPNGAAFVVGYVGRLDRRKGFDILVDAFMRTTWPQARLRLVGSTPDEMHAVGHARRVMERARCDPRVEFVAMRPLADGPALYDGLSVLAIPSVGVETGPLVLREALRLGLPVLATDRLGEPQLAKAHARIVAPNTVAAWANVLHALFDDARRGVAPVRPPRLDADARRTMREVARDVIGEYQSVLARRAAARP